MALSSNSVHHILIIIWGTAEILFFGGIIFGWANLVYIYKQEGYFGSFCGQVENQTSTILLNASQLVVNDEAFGVTLSGYDTKNIPDAGIADDRITKVEKCVDEQLNLVYTIAVAINGLSTFINGLVWDKFGTWVIRGVGV